MSYEDELRIDDLCDKFEAEIQAGRRPRITEYLAEVDDALREQLCQSLIPLEVVYLLRQHEPIDRAVYQRLGEQAAKLADRIHEEELAKTQTVSVKVEANTEPADTIRVAGQERYRLLEEMGHGGFGVVWLAEQREPFRRKVALKLMNRLPGAVTGNGERYRMTLARFDSERQALARMDHTNIARILDGGTTDDNRPFLTMELVVGAARKPINILEFCDQQRLSPRARLSLFLDVCAAIQHAHQRAIIHRDIKPSNILVTLEDGKPIVKVVDFGLAKWLGGELTDLTLHTKATDIVGTLLYMSPEQAGYVPHANRGQTNEVDTRSDLYSLGVILYELLVGSTPIQRETLRRAAIQEQLNLIHTCEPERLSTRLSSYDQPTKSDVAQKRKVDATRFHCELSGELDWIVMKALEKEKNDRYDSVAAFAADIENYLGDEPVQARPPAFAYKARKFIKKHRTLVGVSVAIATLLIAGITGTSLGLVRANRSARRERVAQEEAALQQQIAVDKSRDARREAAEARRQERIAEQARVRAEASAKRSSDVLQIVTHSFKSTDPNAGATAEMTAKQVLFNAKEKLRNSDLDDAGRAEVLESLAFAFLALGEYESAIETATEGVAIRRGELGDNHPDTLSSINILAHAFHQVGRLAEAIRLFEELLAATNGTSGDKHSDTLISMTSLATAYHSAGRHDEAIALLEQTLEAMKHVLGEEHPQTLLTMNNLAGAYLAANRMRDVIPLLERSLATMKVELGSDHPQTLANMANLAHVYSSVGRAQDAIPLLETTYQAMTVKLGGEHRNTLSCLNILATAYHSAGRSDEAIPLLQDVLDARQAKLGDNHPDTLVSMNNLARVYGSAGRLDEAIPLYEAAFTAMKESLGGVHPQTLVCVNNLAHAYGLDGRPADAIPLFEELLQISREKPDENRPATISGLINLGILYNDDDQQDKAIAVWEKAVAFSEDHPDLDWDRKPLRDACIRLKEHAESIPDDAPSSRLVEAVHRLLRLARIAQRQADVPQSNAEMEILEAAKTAEGGGNEARSPE